MDVRLACEESWALKNWCFWTVVLEKTLESPLDCKEIQPVHPKGDQPWVFFGRTDAEAVTPVLCPPHAKSWLIGKDSDAGRDWGQEEKGMTEEEMAGWHHRLDGREFEWTPGAGDGQGGLACCDSWGRKEWDTTEWTELNWHNILIFASWRTKIKYLFSGPLQKKVTMPPLDHRLRGWGQVSLCAWTPSWALGWAASHLSCFWVYTRNWTGKICRRLPFNSFL